MYAGRVVETGSVGIIFKNPLHPYTQGLLSSIPRLDNEAKKQLNTIDGMVPSLADMPSGCRFMDRCSFAFDKCTEKPPMFAVDEPPPKPSSGELLNSDEKEHRVACYLYLESPAKFLGEDSGE